MTVRRPRILFVQHANPAAYPPVAHAIQLLADAGASVHAIGVAFVDAIRLPADAQVTVELLPVPAPGWRLRVAYARFVWRVCWRVATRRPDWIYASDALSTPAAWLATRLAGVRCVYHEHDAPEGARDDVVTRCRRRLAEVADVVVAPGQGRAAILRHATGRARIDIIWNTPLVAEVAPRRGVVAGTTRLLYHGSIVPARVPEALLQALARLAPSVSLCLTGYDPSGGAYLERLRALARELRIDGRLDVRGAVGRRALMRQGADFDVGLALLPLRSTSLNERTMLGASNKVFDYLACGLAVVVPDLPDWDETFVAPGYGIGCDPDSADSLVDAIARLHEDPVARSAMGERGRQRILEEWNYERGFAGVRERLTTVTGSER